MANPMWLFYQDGNVTDVYHAMRQDPRMALLNLFEVEDKLSAMKTLGEVVAPYMEVVETLRDVLGSMLRGMSPGVDVLEGSMNMLALMHQVIGKVSGVTDTGKFDDVRVACELVLEAIANDETLHPAVSLYIRQLVMQVIDCLDNFEMQGNFQLQVAIERLNSAVNYAQATSQNQGVWDVARTKLIESGVTAVLMSGLIAMSIVFPGAAHGAAALLQLDLSPAQISGTPHGTNGIGLVLAPGIVASVGTGQEATG